jgi:hypothetical protein
VPSYVLRRETLVAAVVERSPHLATQPTSEEAISPDRYPGRPVPLPKYRPAMGSPMARIVGVMVLVLVCNGLFWIYRPLPGAVQIAAVTIPLVASLLASYGRPDLKDVQPPFLYGLYSRYVVLWIVLDFCTVIRRVLHW